jgi:Rrf2 family protein
MLQLTKRTEYALIALVALADRPGVPVSVREISEQHHVPRRLLAEVLKDLAREGLVESQRGASGGYALTRPADAITIGGVVTAIEGPPQLAACEGLGHGRGGECELEPSCPIRSPLSVLREELAELLERTTLSALVRSARRRTLHNLSQIHPAPRLDPAGPALA